jgi:hypothetical protein
MRMRKFSILMLCMLLAAGLLYGCGSSKKEGSASATPDTVASVGDSLCRQCHSAVQDPLTGEGIIAQYDATSPHRNSAHANNGNGCEACHGGGAEHNGVGPIPYPNPFADNGTRCASCHSGSHATNAPTKFADSKHANMTIEEGNPCRRCHTGEGAVLGAVAGLTGDGDLMENESYQGAVPAQKEFSVFTCDTCHQHGGGLRRVNTRDEAGNIVLWNPSGSNEVNDQFNLCTSCHGLKTNDGTTMASGTAASGTVAVGHHENSWYRIIATTHLNNSDNATNGITGYVLRTNLESPCFDCHGHEWKTETSNNPYQSNFDPNKTSIFRDWSMSAHAGGLLEAKYAAAGSGSRTVAQVDAVMNAAAGEAEPWVHYDWSGADRQACQRCHTATGASNFLNNPATYNPANNDFSHLAGWGGRNGTKTSKQREVLYCWGCHKNTEADRNNISGLLYAPGAFTAPYNFNGTPAQFPAVGASDVCIPCHAGRESGESLDNITNFGNAGFVNSHYMAAAGLMYVKSGFTAFIDPNTPIGSSTYGASLTSTEDGGALSSTHRKLGTTAINGDSHNPTVFTPGNFDSNGPCVTCHMQGTGQPTRTTSHTLEINSNTANELCVNCHHGEVDTQEHLTTFLEEQSEPFHNTLNLLQTVLLQKYGIKYDSSAHPYFYEMDGTTAVKDWTRGGTVDGKKLMGACFNLNVLTREPAAFVHARTYARRLLYDSVDFADDGIINMSTGATAQTKFPAIYVKGSTATDPSTTESMKYIAGYNRSSGSWNALERP